MACPHLARRDQVHRSSGYAGSVEGTVGQVPGALDMQGLASGTGYLDLEAQEIQGAQPAGTGSVDGVPVTIYKLSESGLEDPNIGGLTLGAGTNHPRRRRHHREQRICRKDDVGLGRQRGLHPRTKDRVHAPRRLDRDRRYRLVELRLCRNGAHARTARIKRTSVRMRQSRPRHRGGTTFRLLPRTPGTSSTTTTPTTAPSSPATTTSGASALVPQRPTALAVGPNGNLYIADQTRTKYSNVCPMAPSWWWQARGRWATQATAVQLSRQN